jgi:hypothetical protein
MVAALCEARWSRLSKSKAAFLARRSTGAANVQREAERKDIGRDQEDTGILCIFFLISIIFV